MGYAPLGGLDFKEKESFLLAAQNETPLVR
jgi:hypothetical protein